MGCDLPLITQGCSCNNSMKVCQNILQIPLPTCLHHVPILHWAEILHFSSMPIKAMEMFDQDTHRHCHGIQQFRSFLFSHHILSGTWREINLNTMGQWLDKVHFLKWFHIGICPVYWVFGYGCPDFISHGFLDKATFYVVKEKQTKLHIGRARTPVCMSFVWAHRTPWTQLICLQTALECYSSTIYWMSIINQTQCWCWG